jgi:hypothetical protein
MILRKLPVSSLALAALVAAALAVPTALARR